jgi:transposase
LDQNKLSEVLGGWEGYKIGTVGRAADDQQKSAKSEIWIELVPDWKHPRRCGDCGQTVTAVHETTERWVRDLPILDADTWLLVHRIRVNCPTCGPRVEQLDWLDAWARFTRRFAESVVRLAAVLPLKQVAEFYGLHWETVKRLDKEHLQRTLGPVDLADCEVIAMDEFAIQKGHRYATVVVEPFQASTVGWARTRPRGHPTLL